MTIPQTLVRILAALKRRKLLRPIGERIDGRSEGLSQLAKAQIAHDVRSEIDTILAGLIKAPPSPGVR